MSEDKIEGKKCLTMHLKCFKLISGKEHHLGTQYLRDLAIEIFTGNQPPPPHLVWLSSIETVGWAAENEGKMEE